MARNTLLGIMATKRILILFFISLSFLTSRADYIPRQLTPEELEEQRKILIDFYNSTNGDNWKVNTNWCTDAPLGEWYGINADGYGVGYIEFSNDNNLDGTLPESLGNLTTLRGLTICMNPKLRGELPSSMGNLVNMHTLQIRETSISGAIPESFANLASLKDLWTSNNKITSIPECVFEGMPSLYQLDFTGNMLSTLPKSIALKFPDLTEDVIDYGYPETNSAGLSHNCMTGKLSEEITSSPYWDKIWTNFITQREGYGLDLRGIDLPLADFRYNEMQGGEIVYRDVFKQNKHTVIVQFDYAGAGDVDMADDLYALYKANHDKGLDVIVETTGRTILSYDWHTVRLMDDGNKTHRYYMETVFYVVDENGNVVFTFLGNRSEDDPRTGRKITELIPWLESIYGEAEKVDRTYASTDFSADGHVTCLQSATKGVGIDMVLMGDCYTDKDIADGRYEKDMKRSMEALFEAEPMKSLRDLFNVYAVTVVSTNGYYFDCCKTAINVHFGSGSYIYGDDDIARQYALKAISETRLNEATVFIIAKSPSYGGTCFMQKPETVVSNYGSGLSYCYFPTGTSDDMFVDALIHEGIGHGFAKLADEYGGMGYPSDYYISTTYPLEVEMGYSKNVDIESDPAKVKWARFINDNRYKGENIGVYQGALSCNAGAYRPTKQSVMNDASETDMRFNAPSREAIWYRAHKLAYGNTWQYDYESFVAQDLKNIPDAIIDIIDYTSNSAPAYDLTGRPVSKNYRGIVIQNGKKFFMK